MCEEADFFFLSHHFAFFTNSYTIGAMTLKDTLNENNVPVKILVGIAVASILFISYGIWAHLRSSSIDVYVEKSGAAIFLDEKRVGTSNTDDQIITLERVSPGEHSVLVYLEGYYPWEKTIRVRTGDTTKANSFFVRKNITPSYVKTEFTDEQRKELEKMIATSNTDRKISFFGDGRVEIRKEKNKIFAVWLDGTTSLPDFFCNNTECGNSVEIFSSDVGSIGMIDFYPNRDDVVLFSLGKSIYAIEINKKGTQNFQPIYTGTSPTFAVSEQDFMLFIKDDDVLFGIVL